ncbi:4'-phosphopantetheinyl transferase superfamily protein [Streptomyces pactum]|uniref:Phosphopantetheinyl transferase n=1 Tax=Streptomyces pactum TaxID=68249 RepID=A8R0K1_9ACTN|nr:4'-phosphopantetheinyl transferase superfamily protein [Streptomyces pactum]ACJ24874.1 phosphopantetheinyl transferase [Streptomyces pactum]MBH5336240.1 4'-phosphopantetheinyl transferase superfamily protein [Streptomyces pactum]BAF92600.1 phosphopantetheinyl transferase [Streptomyces pactum]
MILFATAAVAAPYGPREQHLAGRAAAADALRRAGSTRLTVGRRGDGAPCFPPGFTGSITHTRRLAVAVVCRAGEVRGIGVDLETDPVPGRLHRILLGEEERAALWTPADETTLRGLFVAKEAAFKAFSAGGERATRMFWRIRLERPDPGPEPPGAVCGTSDPASGASPSRGASTGSGTWLVARAGRERARVRVRTGRELAWAVAVLPAPAP